MCTLIENGIQKRIAYTGDDVESAGGHQTPEETSGELIDLNCEPVWFSDRDDGRSSGSRKYSHRGWEHRKQANKGMSRIGTMLPALVCDLYL
jgi:hypothetical protein